LGGMGERYICGVSRPDRRVDGSPDTELVVVVHGTSVLVQDCDGVPSLPPPALIEPWAGDTIALGRLADRNCFGAAANPAARAAPPNGLRLAPVRTLLGVFSEATLEVVGRAIAVVEFETMHRFCGCCANPTQPIAGEWARRCPACLATFRPHIPPAVIVVIGRDDGRILLARSPGFPAGMFSAVAGFAEIGESLEQAARREVKEEVGVEIDDLRYFGSQPWPFGRSLMIGFFAHHTSGEIVVDGTEITEARWFSLDHLPALPPPISIARRMIDAWMATATPAITAPSH
jgi:NAD+ diphosphatase